MSGTKRKILSCSRPPLFCWVSFSPQGFITTQSPTFPAKLICPYAPFLGFKQAPPPPTTGPCGYPLVPKGDYTMCLLNARWPLMSSCLCNPQPEHSPNPLPRAGASHGAPQASASPPHRKAVIPALPSSQEVIQLNSHRSAMQTGKGWAQRQGGHYQLLEAGQLT